MRFYGYQKSHQQLIFVEEILHWSDIYTPKCVTSKICISVFFPIMSPSETRRRSRRSRPRIYPETEPEPEHPRHFTRSRSGRQSRDSSPEPEPEPEPSNIYPAPRGALPHGALLVLQQCTRTRVQEYRHACLQRPVGKDSELRVTSAVESPDERHGRRTISGR